MHLTNDLICPARLGYVASSLGSWQRKDGIFVFRFVFYHPINWFCCFISRINQLIRVAKLKLSVPRWSTITMGGCVINSSSYRDYVFVKVKATCRWAHMLFLLHFKSCKRSLQEWGFNIRNVKIEHELIGFILWMNRNQGSDLLSNLDEYVVQR